MDPVLKCPHLPAATSNHYVNIDERSLTNLQHNLCYRNITGISDCGSVETPVTVTWPSSWTHCNWNSHNCE
eukprot:m.223374 g.223374  ORF g.223374 m.223374 type:complete len:71 (-) comp15942_c0_seq19:1026-1238(-)